MATTCSSGGDGQPQGAEPAPRPEGERAGLPARGVLQLRRDPGHGGVRPALTERLRDDLSIKYVGRTYAEHVVRTPEAKAGLGEVVAVRVRPEKIAGRR